MKRDDLRVILMKVLVPAETAVEYASEIRPLIDAGLMDPALKIRELTDDEWLRANNTEVHDNYRDSFIISASPDLEDEPDNDDYDDYDDDDDDDYSDSDDDDNDSDYDDDDFSFADDDDYDESDYDFDDDSDDDDDTW